MNEDIKEACIRLAKYYIATRYPDAWSEVVRRAILEKLKEEEKKNVAEALLINEKLKRRAPEGWDSTEVIRSWRRR